MVGLAFALGCNGTSTGNPMGGNAGSTSVPQSAELLKSELPRELSPSVSADDAARLGAGNRAFAFDLYRQLSNTEENLFLSPFSISVALAMTLAGAEGETEAQMRTALHFDLEEPRLHAAFNGALQALSRRTTELAPESSGSGFDLRLANQAWGQTGYPFLSGYLDVLAQKYGTGLYSVNFGDSEATRQFINSWVLDQTEDRIRDLLPSGSLTVDTRLVLTNAIYFKANWLSQFDVADTTDAVFYAPATERIVPMMHTELVANYAEMEGFRALELPYLSPAVRMLLILPPALEDLSTRLDGAFFQELRAALGEHEVRLSLPRFQFESKFELSNALSALGMPIAFGGGADFSGIAGGVEELWIDEVFHDTFVAVDEEGTEAAAATAVVITTESAKPQTEITFDRPFLFAIFDEPTGQVLFIGHLLDPK